MSNKVPYGELFPIIRLLAANSERIKCDWETRGWKFQRSSLGLCNMEIRVGKHGWKARKKPTSTSRPRMWCWLGTRTYLIWCKDMMPVYRPSILPTYVFPSFRVLLFPEWGWGSIQVYSNGVSEVILGNAIKELKLPREEIVIFTKASIQSAAWCHERL